MSWAEIYAIMHGFLDARADLDNTAPAPELGFNVRPTQQVRIATLINDALNLSTARWWFVPDRFQGRVQDWKATTFNARIETAHEKPTFATAWQHKRCVIPAIGYYEWTGSKGQKQPWYISPRNNTPIFYFAGLYATRPDGLHSCTILTRPALSLIAHLHPRSPVMLTGQEIEPWLRDGLKTQDQIKDFGMGYDQRMLFHKVRPIKPGDDGPHLIEPFEPPEQFGLAL